MLKNGFILIFLMLSFCARAANEGYYRRIIEVLASDSLAGRAGGSAEELNVAHFIEEEFAQIKLCRTKVQFFHFTNDSVLFRSQNIIGLLDNDAAKRSSSQLTTITLDGAVIYP